MYAFLERCARVEWWGGRPMYLFDGRIKGVAKIGSTGGLISPQFRRRAPRWWWPKDQSWFVTTEIDDPCTYVAGPEELISQVEQSGLDTKRVRSTDPW